MDEEPPFTIPTYESNETWLSSHPECYLNGCRGNGHDEKEFVATCCEITAYTMLAQVGVDWPLERSKECRSIREAEARASAFAIRINYGMHWLAVVDGWIVHSFYLRYGPCAILLTDKLRYAIDNMASNPGKMFKRLTGVQLDLKEYVKGDVQYYFPKPSPK